MGEFVSLQQEDTEAISQSAEPETETEDTKTGNPFMQWMRGKTGRRWLRVVLPLLLFSAGSAKAEQESGGDVLRARVTAGLAERFTGSVNKKEVNINGRKSMQIDLPENIAPGTKLAECLYDTEDNMQELGRSGHMIRAQAELDAARQRMVQTYPKYEADLNSAWMSMEGRRSKETLSDKPVPLVDETIAQAADRIGGNIWQAQKELVGEDGAIKEDFVTLATDIGIGKSWHSIAEQKYDQISSEIYRRAEDRLTIKPSEFGFSDISELLNWFFTYLDMETTEQFIVKTGAHEIHNPITMAGEKLYRRGEINQKTLKAIIMAQAEIRANAKSYFDKLKERGRISENTYHILTAANLTVEVVEVLNNMKIMDKKNIDIWTPRVYLPVSKGGKAFLQLEIGNVPGAVEGANRRKYGAMGGFEARF